MFHSHTLSWVSNRLPVHCCCAMSLSSFSQGEKATVQRWLPHVLAPPRHHGAQFRSQRGLPGHEPTPQPLLHLLLTQHLSHGGSDQRPQQHRGLRQVTAFSQPIRTSLEFSCCTCNRLLKSLQSADNYLTFSLWLSLYPSLMGGGRGLQDVSTLCL